MDTEEEEIQLETEGDAQLELKEDVQQEPKEGLLPESSSEDPESAITLETVVGEVNYGEGMTEPGLAEDEGSEAKVAGEPGEQDSERVSVWNDLPLHVWKWTPSDDIRSFKVKTLLCDAK